MKKGPANSRVLPMAVGIGILGCVLAVSANVTTGKIHDNLSRERHARLKAEQDLQMAFGRIKSLETQLAESQKKFDHIQDILNQGRSATNDLQSKLDEVTREKELLAKKMAEIKNQPAGAQDIQASR